MTDTRPRRPENILYGVDERPPLAVTIMSAAQQTAVTAAISIATLQVVLDAAGADFDTRVGALQVAMLALGIATVFQCGRFGPIGSGYLVPAVFATSYLPGEIAAAHSGGLPLVFGMTAFAGALTVGLAYAVPRLRPFFPTEITGFVVFSIGLGMGTIGLRGFGTGHGAAATLEPLAAALGAAVILVMVALTVWSRKNLRAYSAVIGIVAGYALAAAGGMLDLESWDPNVSVIDLPQAFGFWPGFDPMLVVPFAVGAIACALRSVGDFSTSQKLNDARWIRPDMASIEGGLAGSGLANLVAGLMGTIASNTASSGVGLSGTTGITSRRVGYAMGAMLAGLSFLPWLAEVLALMPRPVIGAVLIFTGCMVIVNGLQIMASRLFDARKTFIVGFATILGLSLDIYPGFFAGAPDWLKPFVQSSVVASILAALLLNAVFRIGVRRTAVLTLRPEDAAFETTTHFLERNGGAWGARQDVMRRVIQALGEVAEVAGLIVTPGAAMTISVSFDEYKIVATATWPGQPLALRPPPMTPDELLDADENALQVHLAGTIVGNACDRGQIRGERDSQKLRLEFDH